MLLLLALSTVAFSARHVGHEPIAMPTIWMTWKSKAKESLKDAMGQGRGSSPPQGSSLSLFVLGVGPLARPSAS